MIKKKEILEWKLEEVNHLMDLFNKHKNIAVIEVGKINDKQIQYLRKTIRGKAIIKMSKKSLQLRSIDEYKKKSKKGNLDELAKSLSGQSSFVFTNMDILELKRFFDENKWMVPAKPEEITPVDIWVPAGDTGLPTGQVISELNMTLKLPTRIQNDTIWVREDTRTHKAGDFVDVKQAAVLKKLNVKPLESLIMIHFAWSDGEIIPEALLYMNLEDFQNEIATCYFTAQKLALELGIVDDETIGPLVQKAQREALSLMFELPLVDESLMDEYVRKAVLSAKALNNVISGGIPAPSKEEEDKAEDKDEEKDSPGIGGLFG